MLALNITDLKDFTNKLFLGEVFDSFWLNEASITTFGTFFIDGRLQKDFFDSDEQDSLLQSGRSCALWSELKPYCCSIVRGKRLPVQFKIIFQFPANKVSDFSLQEQDSYYLNVQYRNHALLCTTGISMGSFVPGAKPGALWDDIVLKFLQDNHISFEEVSF